MSGQILVLSLLLHGLTLKDQYRPIVLLQRRMLLFHAKRPTFRNLVISLPLYTALTRRNAFVYTCTRPKGQLLRDRDRS
jgi:hypothetical protein